MSNAKFRTNVSWCYCSVFVISIILFPEFYTENSFGWLICVEIPSCRKDTLYQHAYLWFKGSKGSPHLPSWILGMGCKKRDGEEEKGMGRRRAEERKRCLPQMVVWIRLWAYDWLQCPLSPESRPQYRNFRISALSPHLWCAQPRILPTRHAK